MAKTLDTFPDPDIPTIIPDTVVKRPKTETHMTYLERNNINEAIRQKLMKKDVYETDMQKYLKYYCGSDKGAATWEEVIGRYFPGGQDRMIPYWVLDDTKEDLLL